MTPPKPVRIGWREWVALPELGVPRIKAKVDTGARTCALHAFDIETFEQEGAPWVRFRVLPLQRRRQGAVTIEAPLVDQRWVRSSSGKKTLRPVIATTLTLGGRSWQIEVTLVRRDLLGFRMLLGRQAIRSGYVVHPGRSFLTGNIP